MGWLLGIAGAVGVGIGSALLPLLNAEAYAVTSALTVSPALAIVAAISLACGQTAGKLMLFEASRRGSSRWRTNPPRHRRNSFLQGRLATMRQVLMSVLTHPRKSPCIILLSASLGVPPLAVVSVAAGAARSSRTIFVACCLFGRSLRFAGLVAPLLIAGSFGSA